MTPVWKKNQKDLDNHFSHRPGWVGQALDLRYLGTDYLYYDTLVFHGKNPISYDNTTVL